MIEAFRILALIFLGFTIGGTFADIDLAPPLPVKHRSFWTHGALVPLGLSYLVEQPGDNIFWFAVGFLPAYAVHLLADMFPKKWIGGALIKTFPLPKTLGAISSFLWLAAGVVASGYILYTFVPFIMQSF